MNNLNWLLVFWLGSLCARGAASESDFSTLKTFSVMGKEAEILEAGKEVELLRHGGKGCLTHMWFAVDERVRIRVYVDGEAQPSIDMALDLGMDTVLAGRVSRLAVPKWGGTEASSTITRSLTATGCASPCYR